MYQRDLHNWKVSALVSEIHKDICDIMKENSIEKIMFYQHKNVLQDGNIPMVTFNHDRLGLSYQPIGEIVYIDDSNLVYNGGEDTRFAGYTDGYYGDYFDVAHSLPHIYAAICDIVNANDIKPNELQ